MTAWGTEMAARPYIDESEALGSLLARARSAGLTRREIARELGITDRTLRRWVVGKRDIGLGVYRKLERLIQLAED